MPNTSAHTPTPWAADAAQIYSGDSGKTICLMPGVRADEPTPVDAAFIVQAVNSHDDLVAFVRSIAEHSGDSVWQEDWFVMRDRAVTLLRNL